MPASFWPRSRIRSPVAIAFAMPSSVSKVSTSSTALPGMTSAQASNASCSLANDRTQEWACVPRTGIPNRRPASTFEVALQPPRYAARDAVSPPSGPCARRRPNSMTVAPPAASTTCAALVAASVG